MAVEAAQALGRILANDSSDLDSRLVSLFRRCLTRPPSANELDLMKKFYSAQDERLRHGELDGAKISGDSDKSATPDSIAARAAWTLTARALINLDETITKE